MQPRRDRFVEVLVDRIRFEQRYLVVDAQHRHFLVRRNGEEPVGTIVRFDMAELEGSLLFAQHDRRALHPGAGLEAYQKIFRHDLLAGMFAPPRMSLRRFNSLTRRNTSKLPASSEAKCGVARRQACPAGIRKWRKTSFDAPRKFGCLRGNSGHRSQDKSGAESQLSSRLAPS